MKANDAVPMRTVEDYDLKEESCLRGLGRKRRRRMWQPKNRTRFRGIGKMWGTGRPQISERLAH